LTVLKIIGVLILSLILSIPLREIDIVSTTLYKLFPEVTNSNKLFRLLTITSVMAFILWIVLLIFARAKKEKDKIGNK
jgi:hypothetical protein